MFCFVFQNSHFTLALVLSVLISQTGLFQYERWVADHRTKEGVDQDVALCCGTVVIPTGKHICQCKSECVYPQSNSQFSAWMTLCCLHPHARQAASYPSSLSIVDSYKSCLMLSHDVHLSISGCILVYGLT